MKPVVCVSFEGVLAPYARDWPARDDPGDPSAGAAEFLAALAEFAEVVIDIGHAGGGKPEGGHGHGPRPPKARRALKDWLDKHGLKYGELWDGHGHGRPYHFAAVIGTRAVGCRPEEDSGAFAAALSTAARLCADPPADEDDGADED